MPTEHWASGYVGLPWADKGHTRDGLNCWGLVTLVYRERFGIALPTYDERFVCIEERAQIAMVFSDVTRDWPWWPVSKGCEREMDFVTFRRAGIDGHVGLVVSPGRMLHISAGHDSQIERYDDGRWLPRLSGIFRHAELAR